MSNNAFEQYNEMASKLSSALKDINYYIFPKFDTPDCPIKDASVIKRVHECHSYIIDKIDKINSKKFTICIIGTFSSGKSTLINSILGRDLLPESLDVTTMCPTRIRPLSSNATEEFAKIFYLTETDIYQLKRDIKNMIVDKISDSAVEKAEKKSLVEQSDQSFISYCENLPNQQLGTPILIDKNLLGILKRLVANEKKLEDKLGKNEEISIEEAVKSIANQDIGVLIQWIELNIHTEIIPSDVEFTDLPGLSVSNPWHEKVTKEQMALSDSIIFCTTALHSFDKSEEEALDKMSNTLSTIADKTFWVLNQWDLIKDDKQKDIVISRFYKELDKYDIKKEKIKLYKTSALYGLIAKLHLNNGKNFSKHQQIIDGIEKHYGSLNDQVCKQLLDISEIDILSEHVKDYLDNEIRISTLIEMSVTFFI